MMKAETKVHFELIKKSEIDLFIMFHGMFSSIQSKEMSQTKKVLLDRNYSVLSFDYPGHGKSDGALNEVRLSSIFTATDRIIRKIEDYKNIYLLGFSFGANPLIYLAAKLKNLKGIILFNPATNMLELIFRKKTQNDLDKYTGKHRKISTKTKFRFFVECWIHNNYRLAKKIACPVYIYHIKNDDSVPVGQSRKLNSYLKNSILVSELKSDHSMEKELDNGEYRNKILPKALDWITNRPN